MLHVDVENILRDLKNLVPRNEYLGIYIALVNILVCIACKTVWGGGGVGGGE